MIGKKVKEDLSIILDDGRKLGYAEYGDPKGHPILYFPGFPCCRIEGRRFHDFAASNDQRIIGIDRPGLGISTFQKKRRILSWPQDVLKLTDYLGIKRFSIFGHSAGSAFISACAYAIPERISSAAIVSGLAPLNLLEARASISSEQKFVSSLVRLFPISATMLMWAMYRKLNSAKKFDMGGLPEPDVIVLENPQYSREFKEILLESFKNGIAGPAREMQLICNSWGFNLSDIKMPIALWHGSVDSIAPVSHASILANLIPKAQLNILENEGHISILKKPIEGILNSLIDACK